MADTPLMTCRGCGAKTSTVVLGYGIDTCPKCEYQTLERERLEFFNPGLAFEPLMQRGMKAQIMRRGKTIKELRREAKTKDAIIEQLRERLERAKRGGV